MRRSTLHGLISAVAGMFILTSAAGCGGASESGDDDGTGGGGSGATKDASAGGKGDGGGSANKDDGGGSGGSAGDDSGGGSGGGGDDGGADGATGSSGCKTNADCMVGVCMPDGTCDPTATDGMQDSTETGIDCGGALNADGTMNASSDNAPACADGLGCVVGYDCVDKVCYTGAAVELSNNGAPIDCPAGATCTCQKPTPIDGVQNDSETDIDCGGKYGAGGVANPNSDQSMTSGALCASAAGETGQHCKYGTDCDQGVCNAKAGAGGPPIDCPAGTSCTCQLASPDDTVKNGGESDVDCGGNTTDGAKPCPPTNPATGMISVCVANDDCESGRCSAMKCAPATFTDGIKNGGETDVDCGGAVDASGKAVVGSDGAPPCADINAKGVSNACGIGADCKSGYCSTVQKICVDGYSCTVPTPVALTADKTPIAVPILDITTEEASTTVGGVTTYTDPSGTADANGIGEIAGITTCGRGEATDNHSVAAGLVNHESCCKSLDVSVKEAGATAAKTVRVDKYEVTAGRMRQFIETVSQNDGQSYNLQKWVKAQFSTDGKLTPITPAGVLLAQQIPTSQAGVPNVISLYPTALTDVTLSMLQQLGGTTMDTGVPSDFQGCYTSTGAAGAGTYWFDAEEQESVAKSSARAFTQDYYDIKSMNCTPYWMAAAFCAWDGGHLVTKEEYDVLWGPGTYPWSTTVDPGTSTKDSSVSRLWKDIKGSIPAGTLPQDWTINNLNEGEDFYFYPSGTGIPDTLDKNVGSIFSLEDYTPYIAAPGRFKRDTTLVTATGIYANDTWLDIAANLFEFHELPASSFTSSENNFCDTTGTLVLCDTTKGTCPVSTSHYPTGNACPTAGGTACIRTNSDSQVVCGYERAPKMPGINWQGGSWEVHAIPTGGADNNYVEPMQTQYGKAGFRCARAAE